MYLQLKRKSWTGCLFYGHAVIGAGFVLGEAALVNVDAWLL